MVPMERVFNQQKLQQMCDFVNDMIADTGVIASPGDEGVITWEKDYPGKGRYRITQNKAFKFLVTAEFNPKQLIEYAQKHVEEGKVLDDLEILILRHANAEEKKRLFCLIGEYFADPDLRRQFGRAMTSTPEYTWIVALDGEAVAGFGGLHIRKNGHAELCHSYTEKVYRGMGFNAYAIEERCRIAKDAGATSIDTIVDPKRAAKYKSFGFERHAQRGKWLVMRKTL